MIKFLIMWSSHQNQNTTFEMDAKTLSCPTTCVLDGCQEGFGFVLYIYLSV